MSRNAVIDNDAFRLAAETKRLKEAVAQLLICQQNDKAEIELLRSEIAELHKLLAIHREIMSKS
jgi:hypothetical protein